jgi:HK97 family phage major capsid protein
MITRIFETSPMRNSAAIESITGDVLDILIDDNELTAGGWVAETGSRGQTGTADVGLKSIAVHEQFAQPAATQRMLDDAGFDIEGWLSRKVTSKMSRDENTAFVIGDGVGKPRGWLTYPAWAAAGVYERGAVEQIVGGAAAGNVNGDDFKKTQNSMIEEYNNGASWYMKRNSFENVITLKDTAGEYIFRTRFLAERDALTLLGKPVVFMNDMPDVAAGSLSYAYANFSMGYTIVDRMGFRVIRDEVTAKPNVLFYTTKRTGGDVSNYESIKILKVAV